MYTCDSNRISLRMRMCLMQCSNHTYIHKVTARFYLRYSSTILSTRTFASDSYIQKA